MTNDEQMQEIEVNIANARGKVADRDMLRNLLKNKDFERIIMKLYLEEEAVRLVHLKSEPMEELHKVNIDNKMYGIGALDRFFRSIMAEGSQMEIAIRESEEELEGMELGEIN